MNKQLNPHKKQLVAVSGGVDSVVLLDVLVKQASHRPAGVRNSIIVAHLDHGIRSNSHQDALFVQTLAAAYRLPLVMTQAKLGAAASEEAARQARYAFLKKVAREHDAIITTGHHVDDVVESVIINLKRGTGWRGIAVMGAAGVERPFLKWNWQKKQILDYAKKNGLKWIEDETNASNVYLRNIVRHSLSDVTIDKQEFLALRSQQLVLSQKIKDTLPAIIKQLETAPGSNKFSRYFINMVDGTVAFEIIRHLTKGFLTPPQIEQAVLAIKTHRPGTFYTAGKHVKMYFDSRFFTLKMVE